MLIVAEVMGVHQGQCVEKRAEDTILENKRKGEEEDPMKEAGAN